MLSDAWSNDFMLDYARRISHDCGTAGELPHPGGRSSFGATEPLSMISPTLASHAGEARWRECCDARAFEVAVRPAPRP